MAFVLPDLERLCRPSACLDSPTDSLAFDTEADAAVYLEAAEAGTLDYTAADTVGNQTVFVTRNFAGVAAIGDADSGSSRNTPDTLRSIFEALFRNRLCRMGNRNVRNDRWQTVVRIFFLENRLGFDLSDLV